MATTVINVKVKPEIKLEAQKIAEDLGLSLSALVNGFLRHLIKTKTITFSTREEPTDYLLKILKESGEDIKRRRIISFKSSRGALSYLDEMIAADEKKNKKN